MDVVYTQPLKELLAVASYFKEKVVVLVENERDERVARQNNLIPCYLVNDKTDLQKVVGKKKAVLGGSIKDNEFAVRVKADFLLQPSNVKQFFDLGLAKKLADNNSIVVLMLEELLKANSFERHLYWKNYVEVVNYCRIKKTKFIVASGCKDPLHLRPKKTREALATILGLPCGLAKQYLDEEVE